MCDNSVCVCVCVHTGRVTRQCSSVGVVVLVGLVVLLATFCFQLLPPDSPLFFQGRKEEPSV